MKTEKGIGFGVSESFTDRKCECGFGEIGAMLLFFMLLKSAILCDLYLLTYITCAIETPCDANLFLPFVSIHFFNSRCYFQYSFFSIAGAIFKRGICDFKKFEQPLRVMRVPLVTILAREMRLKFFEVDQALEMLRVALVTILAREMRLKFFEVDQALEMLRVPLVTILAREMRLKFF